MSKFACSNHIAARKNQKLSKILASWRCIDPVMLAQRTTFRDGMRREMGTCQNFRMLLFAVDEVAQSIVWQGIRHMANNIFSA